MTGQINGSRRFPLSFSQQRIWFIEQLERGSTQFNEPQAFMLRGALDMEAFSAALDELVATHESLRSCFEDQDGEGYRRILPDYKLQLEQTDLTGLSSGKREAALAGILEADDREPFDLAQGPPVRARLVRLDSETHCFLFSCHHLVTDGWSRTVFNRELAALYSDFYAGKKPAPAEVAVCYDDYVKEQQAFLASEEAESEFAYWETQLADLPAPATLPVDFPETNVEEKSSAVVIRELPAELEDSLTGLAKSVSASDFMVLLAALKLLLYRLNGQEDIVVGTPVAGRLASGLENLIGVFIETLPLRSDLSGNPSFKQLLKRVRTAVLEAFDHQRVPFEKLIERLQPDRDLKRPPLFQVLFNMFSVLDVEPLRLDGIQVEELDRYTQDAKLDLNLYVDRKGGRLRLVSVYNEKRFVRATIDQFLDQFHFLLEQIVRDPETLIGNYSLVTPRSRRLLPDPTRPMKAPTPLPVTRQFSEIAKLHPTRPAVCMDGKYLNYAELEAASVAIALALVRDGLQVGERVMVSGPPCAGLYAAMLGVMQARGVMLLIDPGLPSGRRELLVKEGGAVRAVIVGTASDTSLFDSVPLLEVSADGRLHEPASGGSEDPLALADPEPADPAYIFFTSGTTGKPKGVLGNHRGLAHFIDWERELLATGTDDRIAQLTGLSFDVILRDVFLPLSSGAAICVPPEDIIGQGKRLLDWFEQERVTILHTVPALANDWIRSHRRTHGSSMLRVVLFAGEPLLSTLVENWRAQVSTDARIINLYGPTETTMAKTFFEVPHDAPEGIQPIGAPMPDTQVLLLNQQDQLCGIREPGEIIIRTPCRTAGYLDTAAAREERFIRNPFTGDPEDVLYRTGDLGVYGTDGLLHILGRTDDQVKIRGIRIEPAEVAAVLNSDPQVQQSIVVVVDEGQGGKRLAAYYTAVDPASPPAPAALRQFLKSRLPDYMVPPTFTFLERFPLNPNGKVDRKALPEPVFSREQVVESFVAAETEIERQLLGIWEEVLGVEDIGTRDNFFDIGGHSLLATKVVARIENRLGRHLSLRTFFESPTIAGLALKLGEPGASPVVPVPLPVRGKQQQRFPLSPSQSGLWFLDRLRGGSAEYNMAGGVRIKGDLDVAALWKSISRVVGRHESLRTSFIETAGQPFQIIHPESLIELEKADLTGVDTDEGEAILHQEIRDLQGHVFDLSSPPLMRIRLFKLSPCEYVLVWICHHIISDGWSVSLFNQELEDCYNALAAGREPELEPVPLQYVDYCRWQSERLDRGEMERQEEFWKRQLQGAPYLELPTDHPRSEHPSQDGAQIDFSLPEAFADKLEAFNKAEGVTPYMSLMAAFHVLLSRYSGQDDIVTGAPIANRQQVEFEKVMGFFVNTLVQRTDLTGSPGFREVVQRFKKNSLDAFQHQDLPFNKLVEALNPVRHANRHPVFQVRMALQNAPRQLPALTGLEVTRMDPPAWITHFDIEFHMWREDDSWTGFLIYKKDLFEEATAVRMAGHFETLLGNLLSEPDRPVTEVRMTNERELQTLVSEWNQTTVPYPREQSIHELFQLQARATPGATALEQGDRRVSYAGLDQASNRIAAELVQAGVHGGQRVGVYLDRSIDLIASILAILKVGAAYVPLARDYPSQRIRYMMLDADLGVVLSNGNWPDELQDEKVRVIDPSHVLSGTADSRVEFSSHSVDAGDAAYVIYTSGSTGQPKGVVIPHRGVVRLVKGQSYADLNSSERILVLASPSFDASTFEIWGALLNGACCVLFSPRYPDLAELKRTIRNHRVTTLWLTAGLFNMVIDTDPSVLEQVQHVLTGGEALSPKHIRKAMEALPGLRLTNGYGPTECTTFACTHAIGQDEEIGSSIPIGRPISQTTAFILDACGQAVPVGIPGELYLGGDGLAIEYLNQPELTQQKFVPDPFSQQQGARLYRTGDLCRYLPDGNIDYIGRLDNQVKVRGFRVELGEIESALLEHPEIGRVVAVAEKESGGTANLCAYIVAVNPATCPSADELRDFLSQRMPEYAIPTWFVPLPDLPLTPNGKINLKALPSPAAAQPEKPGRLPESLLEKQLAEIWEKLFLRKGIGCDENFFDMGGHSLLATRLAAEIERSTGQRLAIAALFESPTIASLAKRLEDAQGGALKRSLVPLQTGGSQRPLFCLHGWGGDVYGFIDLARALSPSRPVYGLQAVGLDGKVPRHGSVEQMADHYCREIRSFQTDGPYNLLGYSLGGWIAYEVSQRLRKEGQKVYLYMLDTGMSSRVSYPVYAITKTIHILYRIPYHLSYWFKQSTSRKFAYLKSRMQWFLVNLRRGGPRPGQSQTAAGGRLPDDTDYFAVVAARYKPVPYDGDVVLFVAKGSPAYLRFFWKLLVRGRFEVHFVDGGHFGLINRHHVGNFTRLFKELLDRDDKA